MCNYVVRERGLSVHVFHRRGMNVPAPFLSGGGRLPALTISFTTRESVANTSQLLATVRTLAEKQQYSVSEHCFVALLREDEFRREDESAYTEYSVQILIYRNTSIVAEEFAEGRWSQ